MPRLPLLLLSLLLATSSFAGDWHRVLLPIYFEHEVAGAFGSRWVVELAGHNALGVDQRVTSFPLEECSRPSQCADFIPPGAFFNGAAFVGEGSGPGRFVYVLTAFDGVDRTDAMRFTLLTRDVSRESEGFGTQIPVVRESDAFTTPISFPSVPAGALYRQKLRVYDFDGQSGRAVTVEVYRHDTAAYDSFLLASRTLVLTNGSGGLYPTDPGFAQIDLESMPELAGQERVSVVVRPAQEGRYWAFVSVTNNATQQVTTIAP